MNKLHKNLFRILFYSFHVDFRHVAAIQYIVEKHINHLHNYSLLAESQYDTQLLLKCVHSSVLYHIVQCTVHLFAIWQFGAVLHLLLQCFSKSFICFFFPLAYTIDSISANVFSCSPRIAENRFANAHCCSPSPVWQRECGITAMTSLSNPHPLATCQQELVQFGKLSREIQNDKMW